MVSAVCAELDGALAGGKVEKILQPEKDEVDVIVRSLGKSRRLIVSASTNYPRICISERAKENPAKAMNLCMLLRKYLTGSRLVSVSQCGFDRVVRLTFDAGDEMGFRSVYKLYLEIMGRNSNMIFCSEDDTILGAVRYSDLTSPSGRKIIGGMKYGMPDGQGKKDSHEMSASELSALFSSQDPLAPAAKTVTALLSGISNLTAGETVYSVTGSAQSSIGECTPEKLADAVIGLNKTVEKRDFSPCLVYRTGETSPFEYSFVSVRQYGASAQTKQCESVSEAIDTFFSVRDDSERIRQHVNDVSTLLKNARARLTKKISLQTEELAECEKAQELKKRGDLVMQELYRIKKGDLFVVAVDYSSDDMKSVRVDLDPLLTPSMNAQKYYKEFAKKKTAKEALTKQLGIAKSELEYVETVSDALSRVSSSSDIEEIREELRRSGYFRGKALRGGVKGREKPKKPAVKTLRSPSGYTVYVGRNNLQNDYVTTVLGEKNDWWFHIKNYPGSHVLLASSGEEPPAEDFTFCAELAAFYSGAAGASNAAVDYALIRNVKKPAGAKPGFVTYDKYYTAYVAPKDHLSESKN